MSGASADVPVKQPANFAFTPENETKARAFIARYPTGRQKSAVMPLLDLAQRQEGWVSVAAMNAVAEMLDMAPILVYEVASFYTMYNLKPVGKHHLQVCTNLPCRLRGSDEIMATCHKELGIGPGETTADGQFSLIEVECLAACVNAPVLMLGDDYYEDLAPETMAKIIAALRRGETAKPGSQIGRQGAAPVGGPTTLHDVPGAAS